MRTAIDIVRANDGRVLVVSVVHKTVTSPFWLFTDDHIKAEFASGSRGVLETASEVAADASVPIETRLEIGTDVADVIQAVIRDHHADAVLMGWHDRPRSSDILLGTTVDPVIRRASCDVYVERIGTTANGIEGILWPTIGGPNVGPASTLVEAIATANDASVTVASYVSPAESDIDRDVAEEAVMDVIQQLPTTECTAVVEAVDDVTDAIVAAAADHDLVVLGATRERRFRRRAIGSVAEAVGRRADPPVVIAKRQSTRSALRRFIGL